MAQNLPCPSSEADSNAPSMIDVLHNNAARHDAYEELEGSVTLPRNTVKRGARMFVALRKAGRIFQGTAPVYHAVTPYCRPALCAGEPGAGSGWAEPPSAEVTCPACLKRLKRLR